MRRTGPWQSGVAAAMASLAGVALADGVSFQNDVLPVLTTRCVMCHMDGAEQAHMSLYPEAWARLVGVPSTQSPLKRVEPGAPDKSYLYLKLIGTQEVAGGSGLRMPFQQDPLAPEELELLRKWIEQGAAQN